MRQILAIVGRLLGVCALVAIWATCFETLVSAFSKFTASEDCGPFTSQTGCHYIRTTSWRSLHAYGATSVEKGMLYFLAAFFSILALVLAVMLLDLIFKTGRYIVTGVFDLPDLGPVGSAGISTAFLGGIMSGMIVGNMFNNS